MHNGHDKDSYGNDCDKGSCDKDSGDKGQCDKDQRSKHLVTIKNATLAATDLVSKISGTSDDFADWNGATVVPDTTYYDMTGTNASYSYDVIANGQYAGYVMISASRDNYPILELSTGLTPDKDAATVLRAKQLAQTQITNRREVLGEGRAGLSWGYVLLHGISDRDEQLKIKTTTDFPELDTG